MFSLHQFESPNIVEPWFIGEARWLFWNGYGTFLYLDEKMRVVRKVSYRGSKQPEIFHSTWLAMISDQKCIKVIDLTQIAENPEWEESKDVTW